MITLARHAIRSAVLAAARATHVHYDPLDRLVGGYRYEICDCGARRAREVLAGLGRPMLPGWDQLLNRGHRWTSADTGAVEVLAKQERADNPWRGGR